MIGRIGDGAKETSHTTTKYTVEYWLKTTVNTNNLSMSLIRMRVDNMSWHNSLQFTVIQSNRLKVDIIVSTIYIEKSSWLFQ